MGRIEDVERELAEMDAPVKTVTPARVLREHVEPSMSMDMVETQITDALDLVTALIETSNCTRDALIAVLTEIRRRS